MNRKRLTAGMVAIGLIAAASVSPLAAQVPGVPGPPSIGITIGLKATTLGLGLDVARHVAPHLSARIGLNGFKASHDFTWSNIDYSADLNLKSFGAYLDLSVPFLRLTGGVLINKNKLGLASDPISGTVSLGTASYTYTDIGTISGTVSFSKSVAPYLGLALVTPGKIGLFLEAGAMFPGKVVIGYTVTHGPSLPPSAYPAFDSAAASEKTQVEAAINDALKAWPAVGIGLQVKL